MSTNKNAILRYKTLDELLSSDQWCTVDEMRKACEKVLSEDRGRKVTVSRPTIYNDLDTLSRDFRDKGVIIEHMPGKPAKYRYERNARNINGNIIRSQSYSDLANTIEYLESISGLVNVDSILKRIRQTLEDPRQDAQKCISFQSNPELRNYSLVWTLYKHIREGNPLLLSYNGGFSVMKEIEFQPWYLKQYENRWYLWGYAYRINDKWGDRTDVGLRNLAVDRIIVSEQNKPRVDRSRKRKREVKMNEPGCDWYVNFEEFFNNMIGVTVKDGEDAVEVTIRADMHDEQALYDWNRVVTKPLLPSQVAAEDGDEGIIKVFIRPNNEFYDRMMGYYHLEIMSPDGVREEMRRRAEILASHYR